MGGPLYDHRWHKASKAFLDKNPFCAYCLEMGRVKIATCVDHIVPHRGDENLFWDESNWQGLCDYCHNSVKSREERRGYRIGCTDDGLPVDSNHPWNRG